MFDNINNLINSEKDNNIRHSPKPSDKGQGNINLLPKNFRHLKKTTISQSKPRDISYHQSDSGTKQNKGNQIITKKVKKQNKFLLFSALLSIFKPKNKHKKHPSIIAFEPHDNKSKKLHISDSKSIKNNSDKPDSPAADKPVAVQSFKQQKKHQHQQQQPKGEQLIPSSKAIHSDEILFNQVDPKKQPIKNIEQKDLEVNLLPKRKQLLTDKQMIATYILIIIICFLGVITPYVYFGAQSRKYKAKNEAIKEQVTLIQKKSKELQLKAQELGPVAQRLTLVLPLLNNHIYWSKFFPTLERLTVKNAYFTNFFAVNDQNKDGSISNTDTVKLSGRALNLRDVAEQFVVFQNSPLYLDAQLDNLTFVNTERSQNQDEVKIEFTTSFNLSPHLLNKTE